MRNTILLREFNNSDLALVMSWRSNAMVYQGFFSQRKPLEWTEHLNWFKSRNKDWRTFIIILIEDMLERPIGVVNIGQLCHWSPEIGYFIGEVTLWGKGYGKKAVQLGIDWLKEKGYKYCHTTVLKNNLRSIRLLESLGFKKGMEARKGEIYYQREINNHSRYR